MVSKTVVTAFQSAGHDHQRCLEDALAYAAETCARRGVRLTRLREQVLRLVWGNHEPVKAYDLLESLRRDHEGAAPPTVYRALDFLLKEGLIHRIESLNAYIGCGDPSSPHTGQFLICRKCNSVAELNDPEIGELIASKTKQIGFKMDHQTIELSGICPKCSG
ncbi:Fur family transcriptional regulator [Alkalilimnicola ehrlichii]|uniref:Ferric uptake regulation protein n=1 Tax=Alkalilimnicola ehrlichii TaxID=351052 RepID=A0A3E0X3U7_9GAMM|nr:Fur family transcriptional regulator [Alkalilimnicola ehrlichii]RFA31043.1 Fur family transcriptional regulator [Alkalilimnicola ehrlichii]RFA38997.1 Fur family transcriptional regulator [Alkalilimnicola ehrlichii]